MNKIIIIAATFVLPWVVILLGDLEKQVFAFLQSIATFSNLLIVLLLILPFALLLLRWLLQPTRNKQKSGGLNPFVSFRR